MKSHRIQFYRWSRQQNRPRLHDDDTSFSIPCIVLQRTCNPKLRHDQRLTHWEVAVISSTVTLCGQASRWLADAAARRPTTSSTIFVIWLATYGSAFFLISPFSTLAPLRRISDIRLQSLPRQFTGDVHGDWDRWSGGKLVPTRGNNGSGRDAVVIYIYDDDRTLSRRSAPFIPSGSADRMTAAWRSTRQTLSSLGRSVHRSAVGWLLSLSSKFAVDSERSLM